MKIGIVCEGGGMRGSYTAGVLQTFIDNNFVADELVGVSAGASNGSSYVSWQSERGYRTNIDYAGDKRYASISNFLSTGSVFGMDFIFGEIPQILDPFDYEAFWASPIAFYAGVTDVETGKAIFFDKTEIQPPNYTLLRASCSMPVFSPIVTYKGKKYLDGGVSAPIPIDKALDDGCDKLVIILTRPRDYRKTAQSGRFIYKTIYRHYPGLIKAIAMRHLIYNDTLERIASLEEQGQALVIAPVEALTVDRFGNDKEKLILSYQQGIKAGLSALPQIEALYNN